MLRIRGHQNKRLVTLLVVGRTFYNSVVCQISSFVDTWILFLIVAA